MDSILVKRGRPKKISDESRALAFQKFLNEKEEKEKSLCGMQMRYTQESFSDQVQKILRKIPVAASLPYFLKILPLVNLFEEATKQLMMNEIELTGASYIFTKVAELDFEVSHEELVLMSCFAAKVQMENDEETIKRLHEKMNAEIKGFEKCLKSILQVATISVSDLVKEFNKFGWKNETVNYLYYVDDILRFCIPYQSHIRQPSKKKNKTIKTHIKSRKSVEIAKVKKENTKNIELKHVKVKSNGKCGLEKKGVAFEDLIPVRKVETDELKLDEVLDQGMNNYLELDTNNFRNDELNERQSFDLCDEFFQYTTFS
jgi:hypothetical protein